jgi:hypothetical protein
MSQARNVAKMAQSVTSTGVLASTAVQGGGSGSGGPKISSIVVTNSSYSNLDDTAVDVAGGYIKLIGSGFATGCQVLVNNTPATSIAFISDTEVRAQLPATAAGTYIVYLVNSDGGVAIRVNGVTFSALPSWNTFSPISGANNTAFSVQLSATGASTYALAGGSTLPSGVSLTSGGLLSGTVSGLSANTAYNFTVVATDTELQDSPKAFVLDISFNSDPYFTNTYAQFKFNGTNGSTVYQDSGPSNRTTTSSGAVAPTISTAQSKYGGSSLYFSTRTGNIGTPTTAVIGTGDYTMEGWLYLAETNSGVYTAIFGMGSSHFRFGDAGFGNRLQVGTNLDSLGACWNAPVTTSNFTGQWRHLAFSRQSGVCRVFIDGVQQSLGNGANPGSFPSSSFTSTQDLGTVSCAIGMGGSGGYGWLGYQDDVRFTVGIARYTANFTPPTQIG